MDEGILTGAWVTPKQLGYRVLTQHPHVLIDTFPCLLSPSLPHMHTPTLPQVPCTHMVERSGWNIKGEARDVPHHFLL